MYHAIQNHMIELSYQTSHAYADPFNEVQLDVLFSTPEGKELRIPAFWAGEGIWRVRFAGQQAGRYRFVTHCSDQGNADLHQQEGELDVQPYTGEHRLYTHGPLRIAADQRHLEHRDGTPFFWLGDTWWMSLCKRLHWPDDFQKLLADRVAQGFTVVQLVAGLYPDMPAFDPRGANEAGFPWTADYRQINPTYFDMADRRIAALVEAGVVPCIVACWGYFAVWMGAERLQQHWRNLVARYGAYPVVWCLAGETTMPYYLATNRDEARAQQRQVWTEFATYVHQLDPYQHPLTTHPSATARDELEDASLLDFDFLQTGHGEDGLIARTFTLVTDSYNATPRMPVIDGEPCYDGIFEAGRQEVQRLLFWACMLSGAAGHTYGANGLWQLNSSEEPYGPSPTGVSWGDTPWDEAAQLPGARHIGLGKQLLERYQWWKFTPHTEWCSPHANTQDPFLPYAAGIPGQVRLIYFPQKLLFRWGTLSFTITGIETDVKYRAFFWSPITGKEFPCGAVEPNASGNWKVPPIPVFQDWVLVLEAEGLDKQEA